MSLTIKNLSASAGKKIILHNINLEIFPGSIHILMGPNGSGKSTLAQMIMGSPFYKLIGNNTHISIDRRNITSLKPNQRAGLGLFLSFQNPLVIPGVSIGNMLKIACQNLKQNAYKKKTSLKHNPVLSVWQFNEQLYLMAKELNIPTVLLSRSINENFSGGEKKKLEMLQAAMLKPKYLILDEIDTGLDVDALRIISQYIIKMQKNKCGILIITHNARVFKFLKPDYVHILISGKIAESGGYDLANEVENNGYKKWL
jgi:Fe-S cluster assembly ATP-binding protein